MMLLKKKQVQPWVVLALIRKVALDAKLACQNKQDPQYTSTSARGHIRRTFLYEERSSYMPPASAILYESYGKNSPRYSEKCLLNILQR